jgi:hypothetical protein
MMEIARVGSSTIARGVLRGGTGRQGRLAEALIQVPSRAA